MGLAYNWDAEDDIYGYLPRQINRASDDSDSDIESPSERGAYLSERLKAKAMRAELGQFSPGLRFLREHREIAKYEALKAGWTLEDFNARYPHFKFDRDHNFIQVQVTA